MSASAGVVASVQRALDSLQRRDWDATWTELNDMMDTNWAGVSSLIVSCFYVSTHKEWPAGPTGNQVTGFVKFLDERYRTIVYVPQYITEAVITSVFNGDYRVYDKVPRETLLTMQLLVTAAITAHRGMVGDQLAAFVETVDRETTRQRAASRS